MGTPSRRRLPGADSRGVWPARGPAVKVPVRLFARYREAVGRDRVEVEVPEGATVEAVWSALAAAHPVLARYRPHTLFAIGNEYVEADHAIRVGEELACFPPVSGGAARVPRHH